MKGKWLLMAERVVDPFGKHPTSNIQHPTSNGLRALLGRGTCLWRLRFGVRRCSAAFGRPPKAVQQHRTPKRKRLPDAWHTSGAEPHWMLDGPGRTGGGCWMLDVSILAAVNIGMPFA